MDQTVSATNHWRRIAIVTVPAIVLLGFLSGQASNSGYGNPWFDALIKPSAMRPAGLSALPGRCCTGLWVWLLRAF
jgi:hypothetical protein